MTNQTKKLTKIAMLSAVSVLLVAILHFPIIPNAPFLEYDMADVPLLIIGFMYGPLYALISTIVVSVIQGMTLSAASGWVGIIMHIIATGTLTVVSSFIYQKNKNKKNAIIGLALGALCMILVMIPSNLFFTVKFWGMKYEAVLAMLPTAIIPFNIIKSVLNSLIVALIYKRLKKLLH